MKIFTFVIALALVTPAAASAQDAAFRASLVAAVAAHGADLATTEHLLGRSSQATLSGQPAPFYEANPYLGHFTANPLAFGLVKMGTAAGVLWLNAKLHDSGRRRLAIGLNVAQVVVLSAVAAHNYRIGRHP